LQKIGEIEIDPFSEELCDALIAANVPLKKINNPSLRHFLEKYCKRNIPSETSLRKQLKSCYDAVCSINEAFLQNKIKTMTRIKRQLSYGYFWV